MQASKPPIKNLLIRRTLLPKNLKHLTNPINQTKKIITPKTPPSLSAPIPPSPTVPINRPDAPTSPKTRNPKKINKPLQNKIIQVRKF